MFRFRLVMIFAICLVNPIANAKSKTALSEGTVHFIGSVVNAACTIDAKSLHQNVLMDEVKTSIFTSPGAWGNAKTFWIKLENCTPATSQFASVMFSGQADEKDPQVFHVGFGADAAKGVGLGIFDDKNNLLIPNVSPVPSTVLEQGETILFFTAKYRSVAPEVVAGNASASINFSVMYQ
ncbi:fimbrial protein [Atlantibacter sp.]|uniref:fimbrial protein n=1 Tax=Atlantibacter sp. TaxID=1903473 RepID=UPI002898003E|nr:fimbrial protein [Atlantibacter sp.]